MIPLQSGQSSQILLEKLDGDSMCIRCQDEASIISEDGNSYLVGRCSSCSFDNFFRNGLGVRIKRETTLTDFFINESLYTITAKEWIEAYMRDELSNLIDNKYTSIEIDERMSYLLDNCSTLDDTQSVSNKALRLARHKLDLVTDMESLTINNRKIKRAKKNWNI